MLGMVIVTTLYQLSYAQMEPVQSMRHVDLHDMPDALNSDHDSRYLLKTLSEEARPATPPANTARLYLDSTSNNFMIRFDDGDTVVIGLY